MYTYIHTAGIEFIFRNKITSESRLIIITLERDALYNRNSNEKKITKKFESCLHLRTVVRP